MKKYSVLIFTVVTIAAFALLLVINPFRAQQEGNGYVQTGGDPGAEGKEPESIAYLRDKLAAGKAEIAIPGGTYELLSPLEVISDVTINSSDNKEIVFEVAGAFRHVTVLGNASAQFFNTVFDGLGEAGGGLECVGEGHIMLVNCVVKNCEAQKGGGILANSVTLAESEIVGNYAQQGGGVFAVTVKASRCAIIDNTAEISGGGVYATALSTLENCTIYGNTAGQDGGGAYFEASTAFTHCSVSGNRARAAGGVFCKEGAGMESIATIVAGNSQEGEREVVSENVYLVNSLVDSGYSLDKIFVLDSDGNPKLIPTFNTHVLEIVLGGAADDKVPQVYSVSDQIGTQRTSKAYCDIGSVESK